MAALCYASVLVNIWHYGDPPSEEGGILTYYPIQSLSRWEVHPFLNLLPVGVSKGMRNYMEIAETTLWICLFYMES